MEEKNMEEKIDDVNIEIQNSKDTVQITLEKVIDRDEKLEDLEKKSENLEQNANMFYKKSKKVKCQMLKEKIKANSIIIGIILILIIIVVAIILAIV